MLWHRRHHRRDGDIKLGRQANEEYDWDSGQDVLDARGEQC